MPERFQKREKLQAHRRLQLCGGRRQGGVSCISDSLSGASGAFPTSTPSDILFASIFYYAFLLLSINGSRQIAYMLFQAS